MVTSGQSTIRGIDIDKLAKGFADEELVFKQFLTVSPTSAREIRWYQKTAGILDSTDTTTITSSQLMTSHLALPVVVEQNWTRQTSYIKKFFVESPWISSEDINDTDIDILATNVRDLTRAVANQVDQRIYNVLLTGISLSGSAIAAWETTGSCNPILDLLSGSRQIRTYSYEINNLVALMHPNEYQDLMNYIITVKGSSIPAFASDKAQSGVLMQVLGIKIAVSNNCTAGKVMLINPSRTATWKQFSPITAVQKEEQGIGVKIRVWEEGECICTDPYSAAIINGA